MTTYAHEAEELYGPLIIPRGPMGPMLCTKDDYMATSPDYIDGPPAHPAETRHEAGSRVRVAYWGQLPCSAPKCPDSYPHARMEGTVTGPAGERLWRVMFEDGTVACYYHNELEAVG